jgi:hypothetical protein
MFDHQALTEGRDQIGNNGLGKRVHSNDSLGEGILDESAEYRYGKRRKLSRVERDINIEQEKQINVLRPKKMIQELRLD